MTFVRTLESIEAADGLVLAPVDEAGPWEAVRVLRTAMQGLRADGWSPEGVFLAALGDDGRMLPAHNAAVAVLILGYRLRGSSELTDGSGLRGRLPCAGRARRSHRRSD